ncbi:MAG TPA: hypothetical protein VK923_19335 [Euzebyales bacterium]|nr:hypothetical protein [Euzebyales bacterium]
MSDERTTDDDTGDGGPRHEADETSSADAGFTGDEGVGSARPAPARDDLDDR